MATAGVLIAGAVLVPVTASQAAQAHKLTITYKTQCLLEASKPTMEVTFVVHSTLLAPEHYTVGVNFKTSKGLIRPGKTDTKSINATGAKLILTATTTREGAAVRKIKNTCKAGPTEPGGGGGTGGGGTGGGGTGGGGTGGGGTGGGGTSTGGSQSGNITPTEGGESTTAQMSNVGPDTGGGYTAVAAQGAASTSSLNEGLLGAGALILVAGSAVAVRRRSRRS